MSGFKFSHLVVIVLGIIALICLATSISYFIKAKRLKIEEPKEIYHTFSIYTAEGDTLLELDTRSECIKVWIEDSCKIDVWTINEKGGWTRK